MKTSRHKVTFSAIDDAMAIALAQLGQTNLSIRIQTGLSDGQINYRIRKERIYSGRDHSLRASWRSGTSMLFKKVRDDITQVLVADIQKSLPVKIATRDEQQSHQTGRGAGPSPAAGRGRGGEGHKLERRHGKQKAIADPGF